MFTERFEVKITGVVPLLQHRFTNNPPKKRYIPEEDADEALYKDESGKVVHPGNHIEASMVKAAVNFKMPGQGKKTLKDAIRAGIFVDPLMIPLTDKWVIDLQAAVVNRARIMRARPRFDKWSLEFVIQNTDERLTPEMVKAVLEEAGNYFGLGDGRPRYGRFVISKFKKIKAVKAA